MTIIKGGMMLKDLYSGAIEIVTKVNMTHILKKDIMDKYMLHNLNI